MTPALDHRSAARILDLADPADASSGPRKAQAMAATVLLFAISAIAAHATVAGGSPTAALGADSFSARVGRAHAAATQESSHMNRLMAVAASGAVAMGSSAFAQDAVQWRVEDGGNGHWYALSSRAVPVSRTAFIAAATIVGAQPVMLSSQAEELFVYAQFGPVVLGFSAAPGASAFTWMADANNSYSNWGSSACPSGPYPNNPITTERFAELQSANCAGTQGISTQWDDYQLGEWPASVRILLEYSADCNSDGLVDYGQIRAGELDDANANNIPDCCEAGTACGCAADISGNGIVDAVDLAAVLSSWGNAPTGKTNADINRDGEINAIDLAEVLSSWGACP